MFTLFAGTGHVAYAILPVIAEVSRHAGVRPERPMSISVIASQQAITASPISAATVALLALLAPANVTLLNILSVCIPATVGVLVGALVVYRRGVELADDPVYKKRLAAGEVESLPKAVAAADGGALATPLTAKVSVLLFLFAAVAIVILGSFPELRPSWTVQGKVVRMGMAHTRSRW